MLRRKLMLFIVFLFASAALVSLVYVTRVSIPQSPTAYRLPGFPPDIFYRGTILTLSKDVMASDEDQTIWDVDVRLISGDEKGKVITVTIGSTDTPPFEDEERVVVNKTETLGDIEYGIYDRYRIWPLVWIGTIFFAFVVGVGRLKGFGSIVGLILSILILVWFVVPRIIVGYDPVSTSLMGALLIALFSLYAAHGLNRRTSIALVSTVITLGVSALISILFVALGKLTGLGSEEAFYLSISGLEVLNLKGLLLGGIIIGTLGILDDVTTGQVAAVGEIKEASPSLSLIDLYRRGMSVGREHISSLVNTLVLAYAGASLPLFLLFIINPNEQPLWVILNGEFIAEEIIRTLAGSLSLVVAVPIATFLAAYIFSRKPFVA